MSPPKTMLSTRSAIVLGSLLALAHFAVIATIGPSWWGALLSNLIQLGLGILTIFVALQTARRCSRLGRNFWRLASISYCLWTAAQMTGTYSESFHPGFAIWLINFLFASWYIPIGLTLLLSEDSNSAGFDWLRAIDISQAILFWIAAYAYFFHAPPHAGEVSPPLGIPYFICYGMITASFFLRSLMSVSRVAGALFRRAGMFLLIGGVFDALFEYGPGRNLPRGAWFDLLWGQLIFINMLVAATWREVETPTPSNSEPVAAGVNRRVGAQLFSFLYPVLTLCMAVPIVRSHMALASAVVLTSLAGTGLRLLITQHRLMATEDALRQDICRRERAEEAHRQIEERFVKAFRSNPEGIVISTRDGGRILEVNDAYVRMMGYERSELVGNTVKELNIWAPGEREQVMAKLQESGAIRDYDTKFRSKSGKIKEGRISIEQIQDQAEPCLLVSIRDVTESRLMERQLRAAQKMEAIGRLAGGVAHDFNNVLMIISGSAQMIQASKQNDQNARYLSQINSATEKATSLTRQLLAFSRQQVLHPTILDLNLIVTDLWKILPRLLGEDVETVLHLASNLGSVSADRGQIEQVIMNLAVNARDAMPQGGKLVLETANVELDNTSAIRHGTEIPPGHYVVLAVTDTGVGMDAETQARLFEPFFTTKELGKGTGLGLATVYGIVKQSVGYVWVYSEVGKGTAFKVYLPRVPAKAAEQRPPRSQPVAGGTETILLVEDEVALRELASEYLGSKGYKVLEAGDRKAAVKVCKDFEGPIHVMLTDVVMPGGGGPDLAKVVLETRPDLRVIYMSGYTDRVVSEKLGEGATFLQKPFSLEHLAGKIRSLLN
jgi:two-component system, cell cycle sensor histidine kinase and response regulator CckA